MADAYRPMEGFRLPASLSDSRVRAVRDGAIVAGLLFSAYLFLVVAPQQ